MMENTCSMAELIERLSEQLGFYFSDANLRKDRFLLQLTGPNGTNAVALSVICGFNRIKRLSTDLETVQAALRLRCCELALSEDGETVRRLRELPELDDFKERTVHVEPIDSIGATYASVVQVFASYGPLAYVSIPRSLDSGELDGCALVEFETADGACDAVRALTTCEPKQRDANVGGEHHEEEHERSSAVRVLPLHAWEAQEEEYRAAIARDESEVQAEASALEVADALTAAHLAANAIEAKERRVVRVSGLPKAAAVKALRKEMRSVFGEIALVDFVDYGVSDSGNNTVAYIRMMTAAGALEAARTLSASGLQLAGGPVKLDVMRGEKLEAYMQRVMMIRKETMLVKKAKRDKWWKRKYGAGATSSAGREGLEGERSVVTAEDVDGVGASEVTGCGRDDAKKRRLS